MLVRMMIYSFFIQHIFIEVIARSWGKEGNGELLFNGYEVSLLQDEKSSGVDGGDVCTKTVYLKLVKLLQFAVCVFCYNKKIKKYMFMNQTIFWAQGCSRNNTTEIPASSWRKTDHLQINPQNTIISGGNNGYGTTYSGERERETKVDRNEWERSGERHTLRDSDWEIERERYRRKDRDRR